MIRSFHQNSELLRSHSTRLFRGVPAQLLMTVLALGMVCLTGCNELGIPKPGEPDPSTAAPATAAAPAPETPANPPAPVSGLDAEAAAAAAPMTPERIVSDFLAKPSPTITDADLTQLAQAVPANSQIAELDLRGVSLSRAGLSQLAGLPALKKVNFTGSSTLPDEWIGIGAATQLESLILENTGVNDSSIAGVGALVNLVELNIAKTHVTDAGFQHLVKLSKLESLTCADLPLTGAGFEAFTSKYSKCPLKFLNANNTQCGAFGFQHIDGIPTLEYLNAGSSGVTDNAIQGVKRLKNLKSLLLGNNSLSDKGLTFLPTLDGIETLDLGGNTLVSDFLLGKMKRQDSLKSLRLENTSCTLPGVQEFKTLRPGCMIEFMGMTF